MRRQTPDGGLRQPWARRLEAAALGHIKVRRRATHCLGARLPVRKLHDDQDASEKCAQPRGIDAHIPGPAECSARIAQDGLVEAWHPLMGSMMYCSLSVHVHV